MEDPLAATVRQSRGIPWAAAAKTKATDVKTRAPDMCKASLSQTLALWSVAPSYVPRVFSKFT